MWKDGSFLGQSPWSLPVGTLTRSVSRRRAVTLVQSRSLTILLVGKWLPLQKRVQQTGGDCQRDRGEKTP
jgi:hypothetical protein